MDTSPARPLTLWAANVRTKSLDDRLAAVRAGGYTATTLFPVDVARFTTEGLSLGDIRHRFEDAGAPVEVLDPLTKWLPNWAPPASMSAADVAFTDFDEDGFFRTAEGLGVTSINLIETFGNETPVEMATEHFARVCDRAAGLGLRVRLEFMPFSGVPDLAAAWEVVGGADRPNGGLTFDTWHYCRGTMDSDLLASIPGDKVYGVQLADGAAEPVGDLLNDLLHHRLHVGKGAFPLRDVVRTLDAIGGLTSVGPELFSDAMDALDATDAGRLAAETARAFLTSSLLPPSP